MQHQIYDRQNIINDCDHRHDGLSCAVLSFIIYHSLQQTHPNDGQSYKDQPVDISLRHHKVPLVQW